MAQVTKVKYFTKEKKALISESNKKKYNKYLQSCIIKNTEVKNTTYKTYENYFTQFLVYLAEEWNNIDLYCDDFLEDAVDIMEGFIMFCQDILKNNKKVINTKIAAISSFYIWSMKRGYVPYHPFDKKLDRMKKANEEHIINSYFLTPEQIDTIRKTLRDNKKFDIQDQILFEIAYDSANRIGALEQLKISSLDLDNMLFADVREKEGYRVEVIFEDYAKSLIEEWLKIREEKYDKLSVDSVLIIKKNGEYHPMGRSAIYQRIKKYGKIVGIEDFRPHCMRKSKLNNVYEQTGDLTLAASLANHKSTETTRESYIRPQSKTEIREKINKLKEKNKEQ